MSRISREQRRFLKELKTRRCPLCGERMSPDAGQVGIGNPIAWRYITDPYEPKMMDDRVPLRCGGKA